MSKPHKHAEIIKAWADGAEIEYFDNVLGWQSIRYPTWQDKIKYRIKPKSPLTPEQIWAIQVLFPDARWVAMDKSGKAYLYEQKPETEGGVWDSGIYHRLHSLDNYADNWLDSLVEIPEPVKAWNRALSEDEIAEMFEDEAGESAQIVSVDEVIKALSVVDIHSNTVLSGSTYANVSKTREALSKLHPKLREAVEGGGE